MGREKRENAKWAKARNNGIVWENRLVAVALSRPRAFLEGIVRDGDRTLRYC